MQQIEFDTADALAAATRDRAPTAISRGTSLPEFTWEEPDYLPTPFVVLIDSREQAPYHFTGMSVANATKARQANGKPAHARRPLLVRSRVVGLDTGDYSLDGFTDRVAVERKSLSDLYGTLGHGRERFTRELQRLQQIAESVDDTGLRGHAAVVVESGLESILSSPPFQSKLSPRSVKGSIVAWTFEFPLVRWWTLPTRGEAERTVFDLLNRWWTLRERAAVETEKARQGTLL